MPKSKVLTFESWVTQREWFRYAKLHPATIPHLLCDRSPCQDPYFDLFAENARDRQPMISGLCRSFKNFREGDRFVYVTRLCEEAARERGLDDGTRPWYLGVASMKVISIEPTHQQTACLFSPRRYVANPTRTSYPPGLAHSPEPFAAVSRDSCIVHATVGDKEVPLTPLQSTEAQWRLLYSAYHMRQTEKRLRVALCKFESVRGREALATSFEDAPVMSTVDWEDKLQNVTGRIIQDSTGEKLASRIAQQGCLIN